MIPLLATDDDLAAMAPLSNAAEGIDLLKAFEDLLLVRAVEETIAALYGEQEMRTPTHLGTGQEAVAVGVCHALDPADIVYSHHRSHTHYLARSRDVYRLAAELYGREDGCARGRGGSVHLTAPEQGFMVSSAILGQTVAAATGSALAFAMDGVARVAVAFFGDAVPEEGIFYESLNFAAIHSLPVLFVCENNLYSTESPASVRQAPNSDFCGRVRSFGVTAECVDGNDVVAIHAAAMRLVSRSRNGEGPAFLECLTYRWREHVGPRFDHELGRTYRPIEELRVWMERCPIRRAAAHIVRTGLADTMQINALAKAIVDRVAVDVERARHAAWPAASSLFDNVWHSSGRIEP